MNTHNTPQSIDIDYYDITLTGGRCNVLVLHSLLSYEVLQTTNKVIIDEAICQT